MSKLLGVIVSLGVGAGAAYLLDPERGRHRRALVRDKAMAATNRMRNALDGKTRHSENLPPGDIAVPAAGGELLGGGGGGPAGRGALGRELRRRLPGRPKGPHRPEAPRPPLRLTRRRGAAGRAGPRPRLANEADAPLSPPGVVGEH